METVKLFNYKGTDILIKKESDTLFKIGLQGDNNIPLWLDPEYKSLHLVRTSGREYARIIIDKMILSRKENNEK